MRQILQEMRRDFQDRNKALVSEGVLTQPIDFLFDLTYNPQTQLTTMSIQHKKGAPMAYRNGTAQPDVVVTLSNELASTVFWVFERFSIGKLESTLRQALQRRHRERHLCLLRCYRTQNGWSYPCTLDWCPSCNREAGCLCFQKI